jgi:putative two-component system response regulator
VWVEITSARSASFKKAWTVEEAVACIKAEAGHHFDPRVVEAFLARLPEIRKVMRSCHD